MIVLPIPDAKEIERSGISSYNGSGIIGWVSLLDIGEGKFGIQLQLTNPNETTLIRGQDLDNTWRLYQAIRHDKMIAGFISQQYGGQDVPLSRIAFENSDSQSFRDIPTLYDVHGPEADMFVEKNPKYVEAFTRRITIHPSIDDYHRAIINQIEVRRYYMGIKEQIEEREILNNNIAWPIRRTLQESPCCFAAGLPVTVRHHSRRKFYRQYKALQG